MNKYGLRTNVFKIKSKKDLKISNDIVKERGLKDISGTTVIPVTKRPIIKFKMDVPFSKWNKLFQNEFLTDLAGELNVNRNDLSIIALNKGSTWASVLVNSVVTNFGNVPVGYAYIKGKTIG